MQFGHHEYALGTSYALFSLLLNVWLQYAAGVGHLSKWAVSRSIVVVDRLGNAAQEQFAGLYCRAVS